MRPTYEQLEQKLQAAQERIAYLEMLLKKALDRIEELENKLGRNSKNSSKPPSTDPKSNTPDPPPVKRLSRSGVARVSYPQERVDQHICCELKACPHCQSAEIRQQPIPPFAWQQVDLPIARAIVTQFNCLKYKCDSCRKISTAKLPKGIPFSAFGPKLMSLIATLTGRFHLAKREAQTLVQELYDIELSEGSVVQIEENVGNALDGTYEKIGSLVMQGLIPRHFDETSWRNSGKRHYVWIATNTLAAYYKIDPSRSREAFLRLTGEDLNHKPSVTDRYAAYNILQGPHQYCLAHLIRDFHFFAEKKGEDGRIGSQTEKELRKICKIHREWREGKITWSQRQTRLHHSKRRLEACFIDGMACGSDALAKLSEHLSDKSEHIWAFFSHRGMEPTNNLAERDLRKLVLWRKKSYGTRSARGKRYVERITSIVETLKKRGRSVFRYLAEAVEAFYRGQAPPDLEALRV